MAFILNECEIENAARDACEDFHRPNLQAAVMTLWRLMDWSNSISDGWAYWRKPSNASTRLQETVRVCYMSYPERSRPETDISSAELRKLYTPIKSFLTRQGVAHSEVFVNG